jgi:hypothetical protein
MRFISSGKIFHIYIVVSFYDKNGIQFRFVFRDSTFLGVYIKIIEKGR